MTLALSEALRPSGYWALRHDWEIGSLDDAMRTRAEARAAVAVRRPAQGPFFAAAAARTETALGELLVNALRHGRPPVHASISRGGHGWLLVVSDAAPDVPPTVPEDDPSTPGGVGLRLTVAMATATGWYADGDSKHVWALITDEPPATLLDSLAVT